MSGFMLDPDISSYIIKRRRISSLLRAPSRSSAAVITATRRESEAFLERLAILDWTQSVCTHYANIRAALEHAGKPIGNMDR
jgi:predicted nucleic acid-binding protein